MTATISVTPNAEATLDLARRFLDAINTKNADALVETVSEDIVYELHASPMVSVNGHDGVRAALAGLVATWPDYDFVVNALYVDENLLHRGVDHDGHSGPEPSRSATASPYPMAARSASRVSTSAR